MNGPTTKFAKPSYVISFHRDGATIGELDFNGPTLKFTGDAEESAKMFFDFIAKSFAGRLAEERAAGMREAAGIARTYEPDERSCNVLYPSDEILAAAAELEQTK